MSSRDLLFCIKERIEKDEKTVQKLGALLVVMALMLAMSVSAFAANTPVGSTVPIGSALHILTNANGRNECLNAFTSSNIVSGTLLTTFQDQTAYNASHAFKYQYGLSNNQLVITCDLNPAYYLGRSSGGYAEFQPKTATLMSAYQYLNQDSLFCWYNMVGSSGTCLTRYTSTGYANSCYTIFSGSYSGSVNQQWYVLRF